MLERDFGPNTFERLSQSSEARGAQIEAGRGIGDEEILVLDDPQTTFFSRLKNSLSRSLKPIGGKVAVPVGMVILTIAAACSGGGKDKPASVDGSENFSGNLSIELINACESFIGSETIGGEGDVLGYAIAARYFLDNPADNRALYLSASGAAFNFRLDLAKQAFKKAVELGLPDKQEQLAEEMIKAIDKFNEQTDPVKAFDAVLEPMGNLRRDLEGNICRDAKSELPQSDDKEVQITPTPEFDFAELFDCAVNGQYPTSTDCRNELIDGGNKTISPLVNEMLFGDFELKRNTNFWVFNEDALILSEIGRQYPQEVEEVIYKIIEVTECLTVNQCNEVVIGDGLVNLEGTTIVDDLGKNAVNSLTSVGNHRGIGHEIVKREFSRIQRIQEWVDHERDKDPYSIDLININNKLKEFIFHFND